jgi:hypothetical protein
MVLALALVSIGLGLVPLTSLEVLKIGRDGESLGALAGLAQTALIGVPLP